MDRLDNIVGKNIVSVAYIPHSWKDGWGIKAGVSSVDAESITISFDDGTAIRLVPVVDMNYHGTVRVEKVK